MVSLGSKIRPRYSNWKTLWIGYERGSEVGKSEYTWKGGMVGPGWCCPPLARRRERVSKKAIIFVYSVWICIRFRILHCWQTCSIACSSRGHVDMRFDWCCLYYFVTNSLVALLEALCARIFFFRFVNIGVFLTFFFVCARSLTKPFLRTSQPGSYAWLLKFLLCTDCTCVLVCVCLCVCMWKYVGKVIYIQQT